MILLYPVSPKDNRETVRWFARRFQELRIFRTILSDRRRSRIWFLGVRQKKSRMMQIEGRASVDDQHEKIATNRWRCFPLSILKWRVRRSIVAFFLLWREHTWISSHRSFLSTVIQTFTTTLHHHWLSLILSAIVICICLWSIQTWKHQMITTENRVIILANVLMHKVKNIGNQWNNLSR